MANAAKNIVATVGTQITALQSLDSQMDSQIYDIKDAEWDKPLSQAELKQIAAIRAQQSAILAAIEELSYVTMGALDKSDEMVRIANALSGVSKDLNSRTAAIKAIGMSADVVGKISDAIGGLVPKIKSLIPN